MKTGVQLISEERQKQIDKHGFTGQHHNDHPEWYDNFQLQYAAIGLLSAEFQEGIDSQEACPDGWDEEWVRRLLAKTREQRLVIAGALIAAEIDRLNNE